MAKQLAPSHQSPQKPTDPLEQRILDLIYPFRDECFMDDLESFVDKERKALILCENITFLIRHNQASFGKIIDPDDICMASRNWHDMVKGLGSAGVGIFINGNGYTHTVVRATVHVGDCVVDKLTQVVDTFLRDFFPDV
ncbi:Nn.00g102790.m01.CDS01 [Neocucurbitaria sp. VM-36]